LGSLRLNLRTVTTAELQAL